MRLDKTLKLIALLGAFTLAVGCAGQTDNADQEAAMKAKQAAEMKAAEMKAAEMEAAEMKAAAAAMSSYEVSSGDHLWGISAKSSVYGNPYKWPLIYKANSDKITDADLIHPGQILDIETNPSDADSSAAISHAKSRGSWSIGTVEKSDTAYLAQ